MAYVFSGQTAVTTAGTEVALGSVKVNAPVIVKALAANTGTSYSWATMAQELSPRRPGCSWRLVRRLYWIGLRTWAR